MKLYDQHLHSRHSFDSDAEPADNVRRALDLGLAGLTFTEHYDTHPEDLKTSVYNDARYSDTVAALRGEFGEKIRIGKGVEICYQPQFMPAIIDFLEGHQFDLVILSVHWFYGKPIHAQETWADVDPSRVTRQYFEAMLDAVRFCEELHRDGRRVFDVLGHLDFVKRYSQRFAGSIHVAEHADVTDEILRTCLAADVIPEVNTSTLRQGLGETMPGPAGVRRYAELGGAMMSVGSDSHRPQDIGSGFDQALGMLRAAGIDSIPVFESRTRRVEPIS